MTDPAAVQQRRRMNTSVDMVGRFKLVQNRRAAMTELRRLTWLYAA